jgi:hypothetical protein
MALLAKKNGIGASAQHNWRGCRIAATRHSRRTQVVTCIALPMQGWINDD